MKLITKEIENKSKNFPLRSQDGKKGDAKVLAKFFTPYSCYTWYMLEYDPESGDAFGYVASQDSEYSYFNVKELQELKQNLNFLGHRVEMEAVERDLYMKPLQYTLKEALASDGHELPSWWESENKKESKKEN